MLAVYGKRVGPTRFELKWLQAFDGRKPATNYSFDKLLGRTLAYVLFKPGRRAHDNGNLVEVLRHRGLRIEQSCMTARRE